MRQKVFLTLLLGCALAVAPGCARRSAVQVLVTLDGKALEGATVMLVSPDGKGESAAGLTGSDGMARIVPLGKSGLPAGTYKVLVTKGESLVASSGPIAPGSPEAMKMMMGASKKENQPKSEVPEKYGNVATTPFTLTAPPEVSPVKIELKSDS